MSDVAERYVKVFTAGRLLRWSLDRYREEKQGPLLYRAGAIFSTLTSGSFSKLIVDFEREPMVLEGLRWIAIQPPLRQVRYCVTRGFR